MTIGTMPSYHSANSQEISTQNRQFKKTKDRNIKIKFLHKVSLSKTAKMSSRVKENWSKPWFPATSINFQPYDFELSSLNVQQINSNNYSNFRWLVLLMLVYHAIMSRTSVVNDIKSIDKMCACLCVCVFVCIDFGCEFAAFDCRIYKQQQHSK